MLDDFMLPDTLMCHRIYRQCITRRGTHVNDVCAVVTMQPINYILHWEISSVSVGHLHCLNNLCSNFAVV